MKFLHDAWPVAVIVATITGTAWTAAWNIRGFLATELATQIAASEARLSARITATEARFTAQVAASEARLAAQIVETDGRLTTGIAELRRLFVDHLEVDQRVLEEAGEPRVPRGTALADPDRQHDGRGQAAGRPARRLPPTRCAVARSPCVAE